MMENFSGNMIDASGVTLIINRLELYVENEERIVEEIINILNKLNSEYISDINDSYIDEKRNNLILSLYMIIDNKKKIIEYLINVIKQYRTMDNNINYRYGIN